MNNLVPITPVREPGYVNAYSHLTGAELLALPGVTQLAEMHQYMRPAGSKSEEAFIDRYIKPLSPWEDSWGNNWIIVGDSPTTLWSSHTDTVHHESGAQEIVVGAGRLYAEKSSCLGADDSAGVWLMLEMIRAGVSGLYIFHREEEIGGHGSIYIATEQQGLLEGIKCAIALDRKGYDSVITCQGARTCSDKFAGSLATILGGRFKPDPTGLFTDTANYTEVIGECTNLSVGYHMAHGPAEWLDLPFVIELRDKLVKIDLTTLVFDRQPGDEDDTGWGRYGGSTFDGYGYGGTRSNHKVYKPRDQQDDEEKIHDYVLEYPDTVAAFLFLNGFTTADLDDFYFDEVVKTQPAAPPKPSAMLDIEDDEMLGEMSVEEAEAEFRRQFGDKMGDHRQ